MEDRGGKYDEVPRRVWKAVETKARKTRVVKTERRGKEKREEGEKKKSKEENDESKKGGRMMRNSG